MFEFRIRIDRPGSVLPAGANPVVTLAAFAVAARGGMQGNQGASGKARNRGTPRPAYSIYHPKERAHAFAFLIPSRQSHAAGGSQS